MINETTIYWKDWGKSSGYKKGERNNLGTRESTQYQFQVINDPKKHLLWRRKVRKVGKKY